MSAVTNNDTPALIHILLDLGPACTTNAGTLREALRLVTQKSAGSSLIDNNNNTFNEQGVARLIHFFSAAGTKKQDKDNISLSYLGDTIFNGKDARCTGDWNLEVISQVLASDYNHLNWPRVGRSFDFAEFKIRDTRHLEVALALYRSGTQPQGQQLPLDVFTTEEWTNRAGQLSLLSHLLQCSPNVYSFQVDNEESQDANTVIVDGNLVATNCINPRGWASAKVLQRLLHLSDDKTVGPKVRDIFVMGLLSCPEIILCALVRLQLTVAAQGADMNLSQEARAIAAANAGAGMPMKGELMRELIPLFFKPQGTNNPGGKGNVVRNMPGALRRLWTISQNTVVAACIEAWRSTSGDPPSVRFQTVVHIIGVVRILPSPENAIATILNGNKDPEFSFTVAFVMADHDMLTLRPWLNDRWSAATNSGNRGMYAVSLISYIGKNFQQATARGSNPKPLVSIENLQTTLEFVLTLDNDTMNSVVPTPSGKAVTLGESIKAVVDACVRQHPKLQEVLPSTASLNNAVNNNAAAGGQAQQQQAAAGPPRGSQEDIEECANQYFQQIYASEESARKVVEMLKSFKASGNARENDIFACMIHNLFGKLLLFEEWGLVIELPFMIYF